VTLFSSDTPRGRRAARKPATSVRVQTAKAKRDAAEQHARAAAATATATSPITLSATAQAVYDEISGQWELSAPVRVLLRIAAEAMTKAEQADAITAAEGLTIGDNKGAAKPHPAALLARDYRAQASTTLQRVLAHLEG
jgi:hypothetical protein